MSYKYIDISTYQSKVDYTKTAKAIDGVILRCGFTGWGSSHSLNKDDCFEKHYKGFKNAGVPVGVYYYSTADTVEFAKKEAEYVLSLLKGKQFELPIYYDIENNERQGKLSKATLTKIAETFCEILESAGYFVGVYASTSWFTSKIDHAYLASKYTIWLADYRSNANKTLKRDMWQYTSKGSVKGISGNVDMNACYRDFPTIIKNAKLNGFNSATVKVEKTYTVKKGDSWWKIAKEQLGSGSKMNKLAKYNGKSILSIIHPGQTLKIPKK